MGCQLCPNSCLKRGCGMHATFSLIGALMICLVVDGSSYNFGIMISIWINEFNVTKFLLSWICSIQLFFMYCLCPLTGALIRYYGLTPVAITGGILACIGHMTSGYLNNLTALFVFYGALNGIGYGMLYMAAIVSVTTGFDELRPIAMGIMACGSGLGSSILSIVIPQLERTYNWRGMCYLTGGILLNSCVFGAMISLNILQKPAPLHNRKSSDNINNLGFLGSGYLQLPNELGGVHFNFQSQSDLRDALATPKMQNMMGSLGSFSYLVEVEQLVKQTGLFGKGRSLWKNPGFIIYLFAVFLQALGSLSTLILFYDMLLTVGVDPVASARIMSVCGVSNAVSRLIFGSMAIYPSVNKSNLLSLLMIACGIIHVVSFFFTNVYFFYFYASMVGLCLGGVTVLHPLVLSDIVQVERLTEAMGFEIMAIGVGYCLGTPMASFINILLEVPQASYLVSGLLLIIGGILILIGRCADPRMSDDDIERLRRRLEAAIG